MLEQSPYILMTLAALAGLFVGIVIMLLVRARFRDQMSHVFGRLANEQFQSHTETFLKLARENLGAHHERAKGDLAAREQAIEGLLRPVREAIERTERQLQALEKVRSETHGSITKHLQDVAAGQQQLSAETRNLVNALRRPEVRGQWGELTLRRLVELAGMLEHCDFVTQSHTPTSEGAIRPDMVVRLPEGRELVVDVKTPLDAYLEATEAPNETERRSALARHASIVAGRVREVAAKAYWTQFEAAPEFVILFIPGDQFLSAALAERPELLDEALRQNVILATPTSFVALLKAIAYGWQQVKLAESATEIRELAVELHARLGTFTEHLDAIGKALGDGVRAYNASVGSLERRVLPSARRFTELGVQPRRELAELKTVEELPREGTMLGDADDAADDSRATPAEPSGPH
jgi:DNA recombination protein RmuC